MNSEFRDDTRYKGLVNAVTTTWVVSFGQSRNHNAFAAELPGFISCAEWKAIPRSLLPSAMSEAQVEEVIARCADISFWPDEIVTAVCYKTRATTWPGQATIRIDLTCTA